MKKVGIIILNWNGRQYLETYLPSVISHSEDHSVVVIDNNSTDDSVSFLKSTYPQIELIHNDQNGGFAKGYNVGLEKIKGNFEYYVLLNSDVEVTPNWISPIIELMENDNSVSACQPKVLAYKNKSKFEHAGASGGYLDKNGYPFCRGRVFDDVEEDKGQYDTVEEIFWATGACMFVRSSSFHEFGGFDEDYFAHMEEIDLCWRMKLHGKRIMVNPNSVVFHLGGGTLNYLSPRKVYLNFRNSLFTLYKNYRGNYLFFKITWRICLDYIAAFAFIVNGEFKAGIQVIKAQFHFIKQFGEMKKKRKVLLELTKGKEANRIGIYNKSVVFSRFI
ncbi:glycosyltransferase family 2 protein, partial [Flavobacteriales bacterium]|nr:glycosyltransferase family 2 protein [Flavobacteriales bacterium]